MITKLVERDPADDSGRDIFYVEECFDLYNRESATALDHLLHHMRALRTTPLYYHPTVVRYYGQDGDDAKVVLLEQCHMLLDYFERINATHDDLTRAHLLNEMQARIPYLAPLAGEPHL